MPRDIRAYLEDIKLSISEINIFMKDVNSKKEFQNNIEKIRAVERNIEIIGEAVKNIPDEIRSLATNIPWQKIAGIRDILAHAYFSIDTEILWDVVNNQLENLDNAILEIDKKLS